MVVTMVATLLQAPVSEFTAADVAREFTTWENMGKAFVTQYLWNENISSFATRTLNPPDGFAAPAVAAAGSSSPVASPACPPAWPLNETVSVRELLGFTPWFFDVVNGSDEATQRFDAAWKEVTDPEGCVPLWW